MTDRQTNQPTNQLTFQPTYTDRLRRREVTLSKSLNKRNKRSENAVHDAGVVRVGGCVLGRRVLRGERKCEGKCQLSVFVFSVLF